MTVCGNRLKARRHYRRQHHADRGELGRDRRSACADEPAERMPGGSALHQAHHATRLFLGQLFVAGDPRNRLARHQEVAALVSEDGGRGGRPVADVERAHAGERLLGPVECGEPRFRVPVGQVGVRAVEGQVADERRVAAVQ